MQLSMLCLVGIPCRARLTAVVQPVLHHEWFGVHPDRCGRNPFITQCWDEVMHLVSDNVLDPRQPDRCERRFLNNVAFKGGFSCAYAAWRYATLLVDENFQFPRSLSAPQAMQFSRGVRMKYYAIWVGTHPRSGVVLTGYITTDQSVYRALRTNMLSIGAVFNSFDEAETYTRLDFEDVFPSAMLPELQTAPGANNPWLNFQRHREQESSISDGTHFRQVAQPGGHLLDQADPTGIGLHSTKVPRGLAATSLFHTTRERVYAEMDALARFLERSAPRTPDTEIRSHEAPLFRRSRTSTTTRRSTDACRHLAITVVVQQGARWISGAYKVPMTQQLFCGSCTVLMVLTLRWRSS